MASNFLAVREKALANFEILLNYWKIEYQKISPTEYDFKNPTRNDTNFGACRFNIEKGYGADFAKHSYTDSDFKAFGKGFDASDFASFSEYGEVNSGFDIIGLTQRIYNIPTYAKASETLEALLVKLADDHDLINITKEQIEARQNKILQDKKKKLDYASKLWNIARPIKGSLGTTYFEYRGIIGVDEPNIKFHYNVWNAELKINIPCIVFKVSKYPDSELQAAHRIYIAKDGTRKAYLKESKLALGEIKQGAIWLGKPSNKLYIAEGPEEALWIRYNFEKKFVCSTVYSNNFHNVQIPDCVSEIVLCPDDCDSGAGKEAALKAISKYTKNKKIKVKMALHNSEAFYGKR